MTALTKESTIEAMFQKVLIATIGAALTTGTLLTVNLAAQTPGAAPPSTPPPAEGPSAVPAPLASPYRFRPAKDIQRINEFYGLVWGVDNLSVKWAESGELIRFTWHVVEPQRAAMLHDKKFEPVLIDPAAQVKLVVPSLEKVGMLRQSSTPIYGKSYWMAFSNKGRLVKRGDRVSVQIGHFHADGLVVE